MYIVHKNTDKQFTYKSLSIDTVKTQKYDDIKHVVKHLKL